MRFVYVLLFALWQLTAIPFVGILTANTLRQDGNELASANVTTVYKAVASAPSVIVTN